MLLRDGLCAAEQLLAFAAPNCCQTMHSLQSLFLYQTITEHHAAGAHITPHIY